MARQTQKNIKKRDWSTVLDRLSCQQGKRLRWKQFGSGYNNLGDISNISSVSSGNISNTDEYPKRYYEKIIEYNGKRYKYRETEDGNHIFLYRNRGAPCFEIFINTEAGVKTAQLSRFNNFTDCSLDNDSTGRDMLLAIVECLKPRTDIFYLGFSDNSGKEIAPNVWIRLSDVYFVATGKTWYGSVLPIVPEDQDFFDENYERITNATWSEVIVRMETLNKDPITVPVDIKDINPTLRGSAMTVFHRIKEAKSDFFAKYRTLIMPAVGCNSFFASTWRYYFDRPSTAGLNHTPN